MVRMPIQYDEYTEDELLQMRKSEAIDGLNEKQQRFCEHYVHSYNTKSALINAGYKTENSSLGYLLRRKPEVQRYIQWLKARILKETFVKAGDVIDQHIRIAFADMTDFVDIGINSIRLKPAKDIDGQLIKTIRSNRDGISIELHDKLRSLDFLAKYIEDMPKDYKQLIEERRQALLEQEFQLKQKMVDMEFGEKEEDGFMEALKESAKVVWE